MMNRNPFAWLRGAASRWLPVRTRVAPANAIGHDFLRGLVGLSSDWYWEQDAEHRFRLVIGAQSQRTNQEERVSLGKCRWELAGARVLNTTWEAHRALLQQHAPFRDLRYSMALDSRRFVVFSVNGDPMFEDGAFRGYRGVTRDITQAWLAEKRLREAKDLLSMAEAAGRLGGWSYHIQTNKVSWSPELLSIHELPPTHAITVEEAYRAYVPEHRPLIRGLLMACAYEGKPFDEELMIQTHSGRRAWVRVIGHPDRAADGSIVKIQGALQDITPRKRAEEEIRRLNGELEARVRERTAELSEALQAMEEFAYSVAHDLRGPITTINGFSQLMAQACGPQLGPSCRHYLDRVLQAGILMNELTEGLLSLARIARTPLQPAEVDITALAIQASGELRARHPSAAPRIRIAPDLRARGDARLLRLLLEELLAVGCKLCAGQPDALIDVGTTLADRGEPAFFVKLDAGAQDLLAEPRPFEPFLALRRDDAAVYLGVSLSSVQRVVARHGGRAWLAATPDGGAAFYFTLPAGPQPQAARGL
jgi:PAS domain S-box-containing protein